MRENEVSGQVVDAAYNIHTKVGPGLLESVYETILAHELRRRGLKVERQVLLPMNYEGLRFDAAFRCDLLVENLVLVELKSVERIQRVHKQQLLSYLRLTGLRLGLLINFNVELIKDGILRFVNDLHDS